MVSDSGGRRGERSYRVGERRTVLGWLDEQQRVPQSVDQLGVRVTEARGEDDEPLTHARGEDGVGTNGPETRQRGDDPSGSVITRARGDEPETFVRSEGPETAVRGDE